MTQPQYQKPPSNGLGVAGFVLALLGIFSLGLLAPLALLLSFIALFKRPRGLAFAGFIISLITTAFLATIIFLFGFLIMSAFKLGKPFVTTAFTAMDESQKINKFALEHGGVPPDDFTGNAQLSGTVDGWGRPFRYRRVNQYSFELRSASKDGVFDTEDDYHEYFDVHRR